MTTECTQTWLTRLRHDTQQWSRGLSFAHAILNACESWNKFFFLKGDFLKKLQMSIFQHFLDQNMFTPKKKVQKITFQNLQIYRKSFWEAFLFGKLKKDERHQKNRIEKEETQKNTNTKNLKDNWKIEKSLSWERMEQNQEEIEEVFFFSTNQFCRMRLCRTMKDTGRRWKKSEKAGETDIFLNTKCLLENEIWTNIFCWKSNFCGEFSARFRKFKIFVEKKVFHTQKNEKRWKTFVWDIVQQKFRKWVLGEMKQVVFLPKEKSIYLVRKSTIEKTKTNRKGAKQQRRWNKNTLTKRDEQMKSFFFSKKKITKN